MTVYIREVKRQREAHGGFCETCQTAYNVTSCPYWHWSKSVWMHQQGTGHKVILYQLAVPRKEGA